MLDPSWGSDTLLMCAGFRSNVFQIDLQSCGFCITVCVHLEHDYSDIKPKLKNCIRKRHVSFEIILLTSMFPEHVSNVVRYFFSFQTSFRMPALLPLKKKLSGISLQRCSTKVNQIKSNQSFQLDGRVPTIQMLWLPTKEDFNTTGVFTLPEVIHKESISEVC